MDGEGEMSRSGFRTIALAGLVMWTLAILVGTHLPPGSVDLPARGLDKVVHFGAYAVWGILAGLAIEPRSGYLLMPILVGLLLAALDEASQPLVARHGDLLDLAADLAGICSGLLLMRGIRRR